MKNKQKIISPLSSLHFINRHWACAKYFKTKRSLESADSPNLFVVICKTFSIESCKNHCISLLHHKEWFCIHRWNCVIAIRLKWRRILHEWKWGSPRASVIGRSIVLCQGQFNTHCWMIPREWYSHEGDRLYRQMFYVVCNSIRFGHFSEEYLVDKITDIIIQTVMLRHLQNNVKFPFRSLQMFTYCQTRFS